MASNDTGPELSARQRRMVTAMLSSPTIKDAAKAAGVSERTAWRYSQHPSVKRALAARQDTLLGHASRRLATEMGAAMDVLVTIMRDEDASDGARVSAARAVLDSGLRLAELVTLAERVAALEEKMGESGA